MEDARPVPQFRCEEIEKNRLYNEWKIWKRALECYFDAYDIKDQKKMRAKLLHLGGPQLQRVFENLPDRENFPVVSTKKKKWYTVAINALDGFFQPCRQDCLERHKLRQLRQKEGERFADFLLRLRQQVADCGFEKYAPETKNVLVEIFLIDVIVEGCTSPELRRRILQQDRTLSEIETLGVALEGAELQVKDFNAKPVEPVTEQKAFKVTVKPKPFQPAYHNGGNFARNKASPYPQRVIRCFSCGRPDHLSTDRNCPARNIRCRKCKQMGHYEPYCRQREKKFIRRQDTHQDTASSRKVHLVEETKVKAEAEQHNGSTKTYYTFFSGNETNVVLCTVGGVELDLLVDSGSDVNLIPDTVWESLKLKSVEVRQCVKGCTKVLKAYASNSPLAILGSFVAEVKVGQRAVQAEFHVVAGGQRSLLGDRTSKELRILRIGVDVCSVASATEPFTKIKDVQVQILMNPEVKPVCQPIRRVPIPLEDAVNKKLDQLLAKDIIEVKHGPAPWVSPLVVVGKSNGEPRICLDLRRVNEAVLRERHPMPVVDDYLARLGKGKYWTKLDIKDAFLQVELAPESRDITVFITNKGLFRFKRLTFGLVNAPECFQKVMDQILVGCEGAFWYLDDVIIEGSRREELEERVAKVLRRFKERNVELNWDKCEFGLTEIEFLGHRITADGIVPTNDKVKAIKSFRRPENEAEVRSFLGLANYLNKFIPDLATLDEPLRMLTRKDSKFVWSVVHQTAFDRIKDAIADVMKLGFFNKDQRTTVMADASPIGLGALLIQTDDAGNSRVVTCASKSLTDTERRYCQTEKEALSLVWAVERFQMYLYGRRFDILTDCKALVYLFTERSRPCARIERWVLRLQAFEYLVSHIAGNRNLADVLSRLSTIVPVPFDIREELFVRQISLSAATAVALRWEEITKASLEDPEIQDVLECIDNGNIYQMPIAYRVVANELCRFGDVLLRTDRIVVPTALRERVVCIAHEGHLGIRTMKAHLRSAAWWPKMDMAVESYVKRCRDCLLVSSPDPPEPMIRKELPSGPWEDIAIDFLGPLPNKETLLVVVDYYSRYVEVCEMKSTTAKETIAQLSKIFCRFGVPNTMRADNGPQLNASCEEFTNFCGEVGVRLVNTIPYWPQHNGEIERQNRSFLKRMKIAHEAGRDWRMELNKYILSYHATPHPTTGRSPAELMFGRKIRSKLPQLPREASFDEEVRDHDKLQKEKGRVYADTKRKARTSEIEVGDRVLAKRMRKDNKLSSDFGPEEFEVIRKSGADVTVSSAQDGVQYRRNVRHLKRILKGSEDQTFHPASGDEGQDESGSTEYPINHEEQNTSFEQAASSKRARREPTKFRDYVAH
ncbi:uncharacterized protein K02A2.6-like [Culex pipiens pallens]|uniref:uncharacterized protein K02A2.6-like n=1 Tax=Culex pipiens pallens TaxID=42434 RepID=UPI0022AA6C07|nr:uncharacterized protein K02A2.6-like [Culex pipiens pallens]